MEPIEISKHIQSKINLLQKMRAEIRQRSEEKAQKLAVYERQLALVIVKLKNGVELEYEGENVLNPPVTILEKIAKGICWKERLESEQSEALYKSLIVNIEAVKTELQGWQSINRYLEHE